ncbi:hypothetical protein M440DRAFT_1016462 [Trichoderma longibrachiatum ATCC 18648]|uniref:Uncharacterized protein n=1 Tax=Trichoderma longibrachiatum ATCC 18648 TaxID=983965 RepID=A0A2T4CIV4_TRILO|nr:hypothetical protein M440DRAFT_1016462 [Trichoderma longibrachiatum ATCC 18648]
MEEWKRKLGRARNSKRLCHEGTGYEKTRTRAPGTQTQNRTGQTLAMPISAKDRRAIGRLWRVEPAPGRLRSGSMTVAAGQRPHQTPYPLHLPCSMPPCLGSGFLLARGLFTTSSTSTFRTAVLHCQRVNAGPPGCRNKGQAACGRFRTIQGEASGRQCHSTHAHADRGKEKRALRRSRRDWRRS